jgi:hypothetical protein
LVSLFVVEKNEKCKAGVTIIPQPSASRNCFPNYL